LGPSGCGKSTILSIVAGIMKHTSGDVLLNDKPISDTELEIGYMLQQDYLFPWKTIMENILIGTKINKENLESVKPRQLNLLREVGLKHVAEAYTDYYIG